MMVVLKSTFVTELQALFVPFLKEHHFDLKEYLTDKNPSDLGIWQTFSQK